MLIGLDIGTSSTKGVVADEHGRILTQASASYGVDRPQQGWTEQDPKSWWQASKQVLRELLSSDGVDAAGLRGLSFSGQMHGSVFLDASATKNARSEEIDAIRPALLWNDQRTAAQCDEIERRVGGRRELIRLVGNAALTGFTAPKVLWLREHEPEAFARTRAVVLPKDFVRLQLTGELATDVGDAAGTLLLDVAERDWSVKVLDALGLDPSLLPPLLESCAPAGEVTRFAAELTGLPEGLPVFAGSGDNQCAAIGAGVVDDGAILSVLGTSGVIFAHADEPRVDDRNDPPGRVHTMCAATGTQQQRGGYANTGVMLSAAGSLHWARDTIAQGVSFERLMQEAGEAPAGCEGLLFLPHLSGERCPYPDPGARGGWVGLTSRHTRGHLVRAVLEGVACTMGIILDIVRDLRVEPRIARLSGGGNRSRLWQAMQADAYNIPVAVMEADEGPALGAAMIAGVGSGVYAGMTEASQACTRERERIEPTENQPVYRELMGRYRDAYTRISPVFHADGA